MDNLLRPDYFEAWISMLNIDVQKRLSELEQRAIEPNSVAFYTSMKEDLHCDPKTTLSS
jgi:hypothetical protein